VPPVKKPALKLAFPAATVGGQVAEYEISAVGTGGSRYDTRICAIGGFYPRKHANFAKGVEATIPLDVLPEGASRICVTPLDSFGTPGRPLAASI